MQLQTLLTAVAALAVGIAPVLALPNAIPELVDRARMCLPGGSPLLICVLLSFEAWTGSKREL